MSDLVYLACPYSHDDPVVRLRRFEAVNEVAAELMRTGVLVFSPISHTHPIAEHGLPVDWDFWRRFDMEFIRVCRAMVVLRLDRWEKSKGVLAEIAAMECLKKPVVYMDENSDVDCVIDCLARELIKDAWWACNERSV